MSKKPNTLSLYLPRPTHHSDSIIEEAFPKHHDVELLVHGHVLEHAQHGHGVYGRDDGGEQQVLLEVDILHAKSLNLADGEQRHADANAVPQRPHHCKPQHLQTQTGRKSQLVFIGDLRICFRKAVEADL